MIKPTPLQVQALEHQIDHGVRSRVEGLARTLTRLQDHLDCLKRDFQGPEVDPTRIYGDRFRSIATLAHEAEVETEILRGWLQTRTFVQLLTSPPTPSQRPGRRPDDFRVGDHVRIREDAQDPAIGRGVLGKTGTVTRVRNVRVTLKLDEGGVAGPRKGDLVLLGVENPQALGHRLYRRKTAWMDDRRRTQEREIRRALGG